MFIYLKESTIRNASGQTNGVNIDDVILSEEEKKFVIAHELSHIQLNHHHIDNIFIFIWGILEGIWVYILIIGVIGLVGIHHNSEKQADLNACKIIGNHVGGIKFMERAKLLQIKYRNDNFIGYFVSKNGNNYADIMHPLLSSRIEYMKKNM